MKLYKYIIAVATVACMAGCYNDFGEVAPVKTYADKEAFEEAFPGCEYKTIMQIKEIYAARTNDPSYVGGENSNWTNTKYYRFGSNEEAYGAEDYYIRGKVISNDEEGNIYKSLYLLDETGAIEVRLTSGNYLKYYMGEHGATLSAGDTIPTSYVYVRVKDLYIGNYRMMLSIGAGPTDSFNKRDEHKFYGNSAIDDLTVIAEHVFIGEDSVLTIGEDIPVIDETNYSSLFGQINLDMLGRLILFKNISCMYAGVTDQKGVKLDGIGDNIYPSWLYTENMNYANGILTKPWYNLAYSVKGKCLYGSVLFAYPSTVPSSGMTAGYYALRTSGYSRFAGKPALRNGAKGDLLAIYSIYSKSWSYNYGAYQLAISRHNDIMFDADSFLPKDIVTAMTPDGGNGTYRIACGDQILAYDMDATSTEPLVAVGADAIEEANVIRPTFLTHYKEGDFDKFVNYPAYSTVESAIVFNVNDSYRAVTVNDGKLTTKEITIADNVADFDSSCAFTLAVAGDATYTLTYGDNYLAVEDGVLTLSSTPYAWQISVPASEYDKEKDSYYVSWVGEEDDDAGSSND